MTPALRWDVMSHELTEPCRAGSTKREPTVVGKPAEFMLANIATRFGLRRDQICMVGDRLDRETLLVQNGGLTTMLVLSGDKILLPLPHEHR